MSLESKCRLCGASGNDQSLHLFSDKARDDMLQYKIVKLLDIAVGLRDKLPKFVCVICVNKINSLWCFKNECLIVQTKLSNLVNHLEWTTCRLCELSSNQYIDIFGSLAIEKMLQYKIIQLLDIAVVRSDTSPHFVCMACVQKLDSLWDFKNECHKVKFRMTITNRLNRANDVYFGDSGELIPIGTYNKSIKSSSLGRLEKDDISPTKGSISNESGNSTVSNLIRSSVIQPSSTTTTNPDEKSSTRESDHAISGNNFSISAGIGINCVEITHKSNSPPQSIAVVENSPTNALVVNRKIVDRSTLINNDEEMDDYSEECLSNTEATYDYSSSDNEQDNSPTTLDSSRKRKNNLDSESYSMSLRHSGNSTWFEQHFFRADLNNESDLLQNRIPYLHVKSEMGTKRMIYTALPDKSKFETDHDYMLNTEKFYVKIETVNLDQNATKVVIQWLKNLVSGEISLMPYFFAWLNNENKLTVGFKCICKRIIDNNIQTVMNHMADHLMFICHLCGRLFYTITQYKYHLKTHNTLFKCSTCDEELGSDFDLYKDHVRAHYNFTCFPCKFECTYFKEWMNHLKKDRLNPESCSSDCSFFYESFAEISDHISKLAISGGYVCGACGMVYHCEEYLKLHIIVFGLEHGKMVSEVKFKDTLSLSSSKNKVGTYTKEFIQIQNANKHEKFHVFNKILSNEIDLEIFKSTFYVPGGKLHNGFVCLRCKQNLTNEKTFKSHVETHLRLTCSLCKFDFSGNKSFVMHMKKYCGYQPRKCISCRNEVWLNTSKEYIAHIKLHQTKKICSYCQKVLPQNYMLLRHINKEHCPRLKRCICKYCNETLTYKGTSHSAKYIHYKEKHPEKVETFVCEICARIFYFKSSLAIHKSQSHPTKNNLDTFICAYCNKVFTIKSSLISHIQRHMNEKTFVCNICKKAFNRESSLTKHKLDMHAVKKHQCTMCDKRFTYPSALKDHMKRAHSFYPRF